MLSSNVLSKKMTTANGFMTLNVRKNHYNDPMAPNRAKVGIEPKSALIEQTSIEHRSLKRRSTEKKITQHIVQQ